MSSTQATLTRQQFLADGYGTFPNILDRPMLEELIQVTEEMLAHYSREDSERYRYQGSNISLGYQHSVFPRLFAWPPALAALRSLGFDQPRFWSAFLLSKPPHAPPLYWHQDWWAWHDPVSAGVIPPQVFLMYYLTDTTLQNGCLRVLPGTHLQRIPLHDQLPAAHTEDTYHAALDSPLFADPPEAVDVMVRAGDLVIGDARLLHAARANQTDQRRSCLTLWYMPAYDTLSEPIQAFVSQHRLVPPSEWEKSAEARLLEPLIPRYTGHAEPSVFNRTPGEHLAVAR
jgi:hypothetical protein